MAYMGSGESGRAAKGRMRETNNYYQGRTGGKDKILPSVVKGVRHNAQASGGITRAARGIGAK